MASSTRRMRYRALYSRSDIPLVLLDHVAQEPGVRFGQGGPEGRGRAPAQRTQPGRVQPLQGHAVRLGRVEAQPPAVADDLRDGRGDLGDGQVRPAAEVD